MENYFSSASQATRLLSDIDFIVNSCSETEMFLRECTQSCNKTANLLEQNRRKGKGIGLFLHYLCSNGKLFYATCELTPKLGLFKEGACDGETCGCRLTVLFPSETGGVGF